MSQSPFPLSAMARVRISGKSPSRLKGSTCCAGLRLSFPTLCPSLCQKGAHQGKYFLGTGRSRILNLWLTVVVPVEPPGRGHKTSVPGQTNGFIYVEQTAPMRWCLPGLQQFHDYHVSPAAKARYFAWSSKYATYAGACPIKCPPSIGILSQRPHPVVMGLANACFKGRVGLDSPSRPVFKNRPPRLRPAVGLPPAKSGG